MLAEPFAGQLLLKGTADPLALYVVPWMLVPMALGNRLGARLAPRVSRVAFGRATGIVLVLAGLTLLA